MISLARHDSGALLNVIARAVGSLALLAVPFLMLTVWTHVQEPFLTGKTHLFHAAVTVALGASVILFEAPRRWPAPLILFAVFVLTLLLSDSLSEFSTVAFWGDGLRQEGFIGIAAYLAYLFAITAIRPSESAWSVIIGSWAASGIIAALSAVYQLVASGGAYRVWGIVGSPVFLGGFLAIGAIFAVWSAYRTENRRWRLFWLAAAVFQSVTILATGTRSALLGLAVGAIVALAFNPQMGRRVRLQILASICAIAIALVVFVSTGGLWDQDAGQAVTRRLVCWGDMLSIIHAHPWLGWGQENIRMMCKPEVWDRAHNKFLQLLVDGGVLGFWTYLTFLGASISSALKSKSSFVLAIITAGTVTTMFEPESLNIVLPILTAVGWLITMETRECARS